MALAIHPSLRFTSMSRHVPDRLAPFVFTAAHKCVVHLCSGERDADFIVIRATVPVKVHLVHRQSRMYAAELAHVALAPLSSFLHAN